MTRASVLAALFCLALGFGPAEARPHWTGPAMNDDRYAYHGPVKVQRKAKRYRAHAGRHHRRRAARPVQKRPRSVADFPRRRSAVDAVPIPQPRPLARVAATHPWAWLADETEQAATAVAATAVEAATVAGRTLLAYARALYRPAHRNVRLTCGDGQPLPPRLMAVVNRAAAHFGAQAYVNSGYRSPAHNRRVGGARGSQHMRCRAVDFYFKGVDGGRLYAWARRQPEPTGLGRYRGNFIHIDIRPGRRVTWDWRGGRSRRLRLASR